MGDHDTLFKRAFSVPEHAGGELRNALPEAVAAALDLSRLELMPGSFVDPEMAERHTDLLFRAPMTGTGGDAYVYLLLEHQSDPDRLMPFRVLEYLVRIWAAMVRDEPRRASLPPIVTLIVHHGADGWDAPRRLHELIDGLDQVPELRALVPDFELLVDDLSVQDDQALATRPLAPFPKVALWLLRDGRDIERFFEHLAAWAQELERLVREDPSQQDVAVVMRYILRVAGETPFEVVRQRVVDVAPAVEEAMASAAEQLIQRGIQQGIEKGVERGRRETLQDALIRQLRARFGPLSPDLERRIETATTEELDRSIERVVTAPRAEDVFGG